MSQNINRNLNKDLFLNYFKFYIIIPEFYYYLFKVLIIKNVYSCDVILIKRTFLFIILLLYYHNLLLYELWDIQLIHITEDINELIDY